MDKTVKTYRTTCYRKQADGTIRSIQVTRKYETKPPALSPTQIDGIRELLDMGVPKKNIFVKYGVSAYVLNKAILAK
jgi:hypothetical protein